MKQISAVQFLNILKERKKLTVSKKWKLRDPFRLNSPKLKILYSCTKTVSIINYPHIFMYFYPILDFCVIFIAQLTMKLHVLEFKMM